jgi:hypothetical protein
MLRAVFSEVEVVPFSSSMLRRPVVGCGHLFELGGGSSAVAVQSVVGARPKVERGTLPDAGCGCRSAEVDRAGRGFENRPSGAGSLPTSPSVSGLPRSWSKAQPAYERTPSPKLSKKKPPNPAPPADAYVIINSSGLRCLATSSVDGGL